MLKEFKDFIARGNVIDMAVGIIVGAAFTSIVNSLVTNLINPLVGLFVGKIDLSNLVFTVGDAQFNDGSIDWTFLLVGRDCDDYVDRKRTSPDRPSGVVDVQRLPNGATYTVIVRPWSEILGEAESRLRFLSQHLPDFPDDADIPRLSKAHADLGMGPGSNADAS